MPYAANDKVSIEPFDGAISITPEEYAVAVENMTSGKRMRVTNGAIMFYEGANKTVYSKTTKAVSEVYEEDITDDVTEIAPTNANDEWDGEKWVFPESEKIKQRIDALEAQQTPRRIREAAMSDVGRAWLENLDAEIAALRQQLSHEE